MPRIACRHQESAKAPALFCRDAGSLNVVVQLALSVEHLEDQVWQSDDTTTSCRCCETAFGLFNRRHHCRICGEHTQTPPPAVSHSIFCVVCVCVVTAGRSACRPDLLQRLPPPLAAGETPAPTPPLPLGRLSVALHCLSLRLHGRRLTDGRFYRSTSSRFRSRRLPATTTATRWL